MRIKKNPTGKLPRPLVGLIETLMSQKDLSMDDILEAIENVSSAYGTDWSGFAMRLAAAIAWRKAHKKLAEPWNKSSTFVERIPPEEFIVTPTLRRGYLHNSVYWLDPETTTLRYARERGYHNIKKWAGKVIDDWWTRSADIAGVDYLVIYPSYFFAGEEGRDRFLVVYADDKFVHAKAVPEQGVRYTGGFTITWGSLARLRTFGVHARPGIAPVDVVLDDSGRPEAVIAFTPVRQPAGHQFDDVPYPFNKQYFLLKRFPFPLPSNP